MSDFIDKEFKNFRLVFDSPDKSFQIQFGSHTIHADTIIYASHTIFNLSKNGKYIGHLLMHSEERQLKRFLKKVSKV